MKPDFYMLATFAKSHDNSTKDSGKIHLISSTFICKKFNITGLKSINQNTLVIRLCVGKDHILGSEYKVIEHSETLTEVITSYSYFFSMFLGNSSIGVGVEFLKYIIQFNNSVAKNFEVPQFFRTNTLKNILFVIENVPLDMLALNFKSIGVTISGGTISQRTVLSSSQYNLSKYLLFLGYTSHDVYLSQSKKLLIDIDNNFTFEVDSVIQNEYFIFFIQEVLEQDIQNLKNELKHKQKKISQREESIANFTDILSGEKSTNSRNFLINKIKACNQFISNAKGEISKLESQIDKIKNTIRDLPTKDRAEIRNLYYNKFYYNKLTRDSLNFGSLISNFNQKKLKARRNLKKYG